jgi:hypothetical protein
VPPKEHSPDVISNISVSSLLDLHLATFLIYYVGLWPPAGQINLGVLPVFNPASLGNATIATPTCVGIDASNHTPLHGKPSGCSVLDTVPTGMYFLPMALVACLLVHYAFRPRRARAPSPPLSIYAQTAKAASLAIGAGSPEGDFLVFRSAKPLLELRAHPLYRILSYTWKDRSCSVRLLPRLLGGMNRFTTSASRKRPPTNVRERAVGNYKLILTGINANSVTFQRSLEEFLDSKDPSSTPSFYDWWQVDTCLLTFNHDDRRKRFLSVISPF